MAKEKTKADQFARYQSMESGSKMNLEEARKRIAEKRREGDKILAKPMRKR